MRGWWLIVGDVPIFNAFHDVRFDKYMEFVNVRAAISAFYMIDEQLRAPDVERAARASRAAARDIAAHKNMLNAERRRAIEQIHARFEAAEEEYRKNHATAIHNANDIITTRKKDTIAMVIASGLCRKNTEQEHIDKEMELAYRERNRQLTALWHGQKR